MCADHAYEKEEKTGPASLPVPDTGLDLTIFQDIPQQPDGPCICSKPTLSFHGRK